jgi:hypothetical protein
MRLKPKAEHVRLALLAGMACVVFHCLLTWHLAGGLDARWYGYTMIDALAQSRNGHWPVLVGQGELQWNGAIHPYLTAPYFLNLGILVDTLTAHLLSPLLVEHLVLLLALLQAVFLTYFLLARLEPGWRWLAWAAASAWLLAPFPLGYLVKMEMYMTVMAFSWLPLVFYGNVRLIRRDDWPGWACLAGGLALTWMSHAVVAAWASIITALIQGLRLVLRDFTWRSWRRALGGALLFGLLGAYYFCSMAMVSSSKTGTSLQTQASLAGLLIGLAAAFRLIAGGSRHWRWLVMVSLGSLWPTNGLYFNWVAGLWLWSELAGAVNHWRPSGFWAARRPEIAMAGVAVGAVLAIHAPFHVAPSSLGMGQQAVLGLRSLYPAILLPISPRGIALSDLQLGYVLWAAGISGFLLALWRGTFAARICALAMAALVPLLVPIPGLTDCVMWSIPDWLYGMGSVTVWFRLYPAFAVLLLFAAFLGLADARLRFPRGRWRVAGVSLILAGAVCWDGLELEKLWMLAEGNVASAEGTKAFYRTESAPLYYGYDVLPHPSYNLNGVMDYHLESRLLRADNLHLLPEPLLEAPHGEKMVLMAKPNPLAPSVLVLSPRIRLAPGEREIWKFEFFDKKYEGWFVGLGPGGYSRYYMLPDGGYAENSFGVGPGRPKTLAFWNSQSVPQDIDFTFEMPDAQPGFGDKFANVTVQRYRVEDLQIQTLGLIPYRARVKVVVPSYLETPRVFIPGYQAKVDGRRAPVQMSPDFLAMIRLDPGRHEVELSYHAPLKLKLAGLASAGGWLGLAVCGARRRRRSAD